MDNQTANIPITNEKIRESLQPVLAEKVKKAITEANADDGTGIKKIPTQQLLDALYFIQDVASRGQMDLFLIGDTAKQVKANEDLTGDKITVGVRINEWHSAMGRLARDFLIHEKKDLLINKEKTVVKFAFRDVPIFMKLYEDNPFITSLDVVFYRYETFNLPNPLNAFSKLYE